MNYPDDDIESGLNACLARNQTTALPSGRANAGLERGPVLCTTHLEFGDLVSVHAMGGTRHYTLAKKVPCDETHPPLVLVRIDRAKPGEAEIYRMGIDGHTYLGTARYNRPA